MHCILYAIYDQENFSCAGVSEDLPTVTLKDIPGLRWVLAKGEYIAEGEGEAEAEDGVGSTAAAALWAVDSLQRRTGLLPATQLSQIDRQHKTPVGLVREVKVTSAESAADSVVVEIWFIEDVLVEDSAGGGGNQHAQQPATGPSASDHSSRRLQGRAAQQNSEAAAADNNAAQEEDCPLRSILRAAESPLPEVLDGVVIDLQSFPGAFARAGLLELPYTDIAVKLCEVKKVQSAFGPLRGLAPASTQNAALGVATAIAVAEETNAKRAAESKPHT